MANYQLLKADIDEKVYQNGAQEITGANLNSVLNEMVTTLGAEYQFAGVATTVTNPGTPDAKVFYIANGKGTYTNFGGVSVTEDDVVVLYWDSSWHKVSTGIASQAKLSELESEFEKTKTFSLYGEYKTFDFPMSKGEKYEFKLIEATSSEILYYVKSDGTKGTIGNLVVGEDWFTWTCIEDAVGIYFGSAQKGVVEARLSGIKKDIEDVQSELMIVQSDVKALQKDVITNMQYIKGLDISTSVGTEYKIIPYPFGKGGKYKINFTKEGGGYVDVFSVKDNGEVSSTKIDSIKIGTPYIWQPQEDYAGIKLGNSGTTLYVEINTENNLTAKFDSITQMIEMYASSEDGTDDATHYYGWKDGKCAIQRAIDACDGVTHTKIYCKGKFYANSASLFTYQANGYYNIVFIPRNKKNIELIGEGADKTIIEVEMADDFANYSKYQPLEVWGDNIVVRGMKIISKNCRYCIHLDASGHASANGHTIIFKDLHLYHQGNAQRSFETPLGLGISSGMKLYTERCIIETNRDYVPPLYLHDNINFREDFEWHIKGCTLISKGQSGANKGVTPLDIQTLGSGVKGNIIMEDVDFALTSPIINIENNNTTSKDNRTSYDSNIFVRIIGHTDLPIGYSVTNTNSGVLRITSKSKGNQSSVRFDKDCSAFGVIIKGLLPSDYTEKNGVIHTDGYQYRDGVVGLNGYAMGELALDKGSICSIQNRLGDCSSLNKELIVIIDGNNYTINFNKNYTNYSDADMLAEFSNVIGAVANVEFYNWGADYFPEFHVSHKRNISTEVILKGMGVRVRGTDIRKATNDSEVDAIALEDILPSYIGRIATSCTLSIFESDHHHIALSSYPQTENDKYEPAYQGEFGIGDDPGIFIKKDGGKVKMLFWGYLTLQ